jgi:signal transduction histidine kinase/ActR/RegA family two-component response regulator
VDREQRGDRSDSRAADRHRELRDAVEQSSASREILLALGRVDADPDTILDAIVERATRLCHADAGQLYLVDGDKIRLSRTVGTSSNVEFRRYIESHPVDRDRMSLVGRVAVDRRTQQIADVLADAEYQRLDLQRIGGYRTLLAAPMMLDDEVIGVFSMWRMQVSPFDEHELRQLDEFGIQGAIALRQVELLRAVEARSGELATKVVQLEALREVGEVVSSSLDLDEVLQTIVTNAVRLTGTDGGSIMEYVADEQTFSVRATHGSSKQLIERLRTITISRDTTLVGRAALERRPVQVPDLGAQPLDPHLQTLYDDGWRSVLAVPMIRLDEIVGVLVIRRMRPGSFDAGTFELLETFASQSALAIHNARLYRELETSSRELEVASRHKSEFLASMSHELRTPLNAVIGFSEVLLDQMFGELNERQTEYLRDIWTSGRHLLELLNDILDLSKVEAGEMQLDQATFVVSDAIAQAVKLVRERAQAHGIALLVEVDADVGEIEADELRFRQVLLNLLSNAVKFTPDGGEVRLEAHCSESDLTVTVTDTGIGVTPEDRERIFESFQQGRRGTPKEEGTGLGLSLTRRIVELFGGRLWMESVVDVGSTFGFTIPRHPQAVPTPSTGAEPVLEQRPRVMLVDDDRASLDLLAAYLEPWGVEVVRCHDGAHALKLLRRKSPHAVVLDIRLPGMDGWELLRTIKSDARTEHIPVVLVTIVDERARGMAMGAYDYLIKPVSREDLIGSLRDAGVLDSKKRTLEVP